MANLNDFQIFHGSGGGGGGGGGGDRGGDNPGGDGPPDPIPECPSRTIARLMDVATLGNYALLATVAKGTSLNLVKGAGLYEVKFGGSVIGILPPEKSLMIEQCEQHGYTYTVQLDSAQLSPSSPVITVVLMRN